MAQRRLNSIEDVKRFLGHLIREIEADRIDPQKGGRLAYIASILIRAIEGAEIEKRLTELENWMKLEAK